MTEPISYIDMVGPELISRIMKGEREFSRIRLPPGTDLTKDQSYGRFIEYLRKQDFEKDAIYLEGASLVGLVAPGLYLPYIVANDADLSGSNIEGSLLDYGDFHDAKFSKAILRRIRAIEASFNDADFDGKEKGADLWLANFYNCYFYNANFRNSVLRKASFRRCRFKLADFDNADVNEASFAKSRLLGVKNLETARNLHYAYFKKTHVDEATKVLIQQRRLEYQQEFILAEDPTLA